MMQTMQKALKLLLEQSLGKDSQGSGQGNTREGSGRVKEMCGVVTSGTNRILSVGESLYSNMLLRKRPTAHPTHRNTSLSS